MREVLQPSKWRLAAIWIACFGPSGRPPLRTSLLLIASFLVAIQTGAQAVEEGQFGPLDATGADSICHDPAPPSLQAHEAARVETAAEPPRLRDRSCYASPEQVQALIVDPRSLIVDTRDVTAFERFRIPRSIHVGLAELRTKQHWRERPVLLANEGYAHGELERACRQLRSNGFESVYILEGGLQAWMQTVGPLEGQKAGQAELTRIPSAAFTRERRYGDFVIIDVSNDANGAVRQWLPEALILPFSSDLRDESEFLQRLSELLRQRERSRPGSRVLIVDLDDRSYSRIETALSALGRDDALFLAGGLEKYVEFRHQRAAMLAQSGRPRTRRSCGS